MTVTGDTLKAHGLEGSLEKPDWPPLTLNEVDKLLRRYPQTGGARALLSFSPRPFSTASVVATPMGKVSVKRHPLAVRDRDGLLEEHRLIAHLADAMREMVESDRSCIFQDLVQPVLPDFDGETALTLGNWTYEVHPLALGVDVYEQALSWTPFLFIGHARAAGRALAQLHRAARSYQAPARKAQQLVTSFNIFAGFESDANLFAHDSNVNPRDRMQAYLSSRPELLGYAEERNWKASYDEIFLPLYHNLEPWLPHLQPLWTHNDFHASNLMWSSDGADAHVCGIIDFGLADRTNAVHDLATAIERNIVEWLRMAEPDAKILHLDHLDALLSGYEEISPLSYEEARALLALLPIVHCEFALSETDYFLSILHSREKAYLAYEGYFLAHTEWFRSAEGRRLLEHLERWMESRRRVAGGKR